MRLARELPWSAAGVVALTALVYVSAARTVFQFDDYNVIVDNPEVHSLGAWTQALGAGVRPLLRLSYTLNWLTETGPASFVLVNVIVHLLNTLLVLVLARSWLTARSEWLEPTARGVVSVLAALLFALHPAQTEAVTYVCGRSTSLMALPYLAVLALHGREQGRRGHVVLGMLGMVAALAVKETAITLPLALMWWDRARGLAWGAAWRRTRPYWLLALGVALVFLLTPAYRTHWQRSLDFNTLYGNLATQSLAWVYLLRQTLWPLALNIDPDLPVLSGFDGVGWLVVAALGGAVVTGLALRWRPWWGWALLWAALHWVPLHLLLPRLDVANDRQLYLALWPLAMALAVELGRWRRAGVAVMLGLVLLTGLTALTVQRNRLYASEVALWEDTARQSSGKARVFNNLGYAYSLAGREDDAVAAYRRALCLDGHDVKARLNLYRLRPDPKLLQNP